MLTEVMTRCCYCKCRSNAMVHSQTHAAKAEQGGAYGRSG